MNNVRVLTADEAAEARRSSRADFERLLEGAGAVVPAVYLDRWWEHKGDTAEQRGVA